MMRVPVSLVNHANFSHPGRLEIVNKVCLSLAFGIGLIVLAGWLSPTFAALLPNGWSIMQSTTAFCVLLLSTNMLLPRIGRVLWRWLHRTCLAAALLVIGLVLTQHATGYDSGVSALLVSDAMAPQSHPMSMQSAVCFLLLGLSLSIEVTRQGIYGKFLDFLLIVLQVFNLIFIAAYFYGADHLIGFERDIRISFQTLSCLLMMTYVLTIRRVPYGIYSLLLLNGIGGHFARIMLPLSIGLSSLIVLLGERSVSLGLLNIPHSAAMTSAIMASLLSIVVLAMGRKIHGLEGELFKLSVTDELTGIYNRRGFYLLGEQAIHDAYRNRRALMLLVLDVDGLKRVNDTFGHEIGSKLIQDVAGIMDRCVRKSDILGRLGGDEFAILAHGRQEKMQPLLQRLKDTARAINASGVNPYTISFSIGSLPVDSQANKSLDELLERADAEMYRNKRQRSAMRDPGLAKAGVDPALIAGS